MIVIDCISDSILSFYLRVYRVHNWRSVHGSEQIALKNQLRPHRSGPVTFDHRILTWISGFQPQQLGSRPNPRNMVKPTKGQARCVVFFIFQASCCWFCLTNGQTMTNLQLGCASDVNRGILGL